MPRHHHLVVSVLAVLASTAALAPSAGATTRGERELELCGANRVVAHASSGKAARLPGGRVTVHACRDGRWVPTTVQALRREGAGDYRLRVRRRAAGAARRLTYLRVGVGEIVDVPVSFRVRNTNRSAIPCVNAPDGGTYTVRGSLVAPRSRLADLPALADDSSVALYLHGFGYGEFFFRFKPVPDYDYGLQQAEAGHASVVVDRLGYPGSAGPADGNRICLGSQADAADQMVRALRSGDYTIGDDDAGQRFDRVALVGHSAGGFLAELAQASFASADAIGVVGYNDTMFSGRALATVGLQQAKCLTSPQRAQGDSGPRNYAYFGETPGAFVIGHFHDADPQVVSEAVKLRNREPCGDVSSFGPANAINQLRVQLIRVPVLVAAGADDEFFPLPGPQVQGALRFPLRAAEVRVEILENTGHAVTLGRTHERFRAVMDSWLGQGGF